MKKYEKLAFGVCMICCLLVSGCMWSPENVAGASGKDEEPFAYLVDTVAVLTPELPSFVDLELENISAYLRQHDTVRVVTAMDSLCLKLETLSGVDSLALKEEWERDVTIYLDSNKAEFRSLRIDVESFRVRLLGK